MNEKANDFEKIRNDATQLFLVGGREFAELRYGGGKEQQAALDRFDIKRLVERFTGHIPRLQRLGKR